MDRAHVMDRAQPSQAPHAREPVVLLLPLDIDVGITRSKI